ncbi:transporter [Cryptosporangium sp. NPDC051539]|uniref:SLAC1 family transporter n=1 Tax=Cryptosporangium sp. NPDC051539 TaxID=3363962 RepID=UPI0037939E6E
MSPWCGFRRVSSLAVITPMLLAAQAVFPHAETLGRVLVDVVLVLVVLLGGWLTGQWIYGPVAIDQVHPGYFLPTVAGGLLAAFSAAAVGQRSLGWVLFGLGTICWLVLGSIVLARLLVRPMLPTPLVPTLAIEVAPAPVASLAWFQLQGHGVDPVALFLGWEYVVVAAISVLIVAIAARTVVALSRGRFLPRPPVPAVTPAAATAGK